MLFKAENEHSWETPLVSVPLVPQSRSLWVIPPHTQVKVDIRSQEEGAADEAAEGNSAAPPAITGAWIGELPLHPGSTGEY